jgi:ribonuclease BN (tRNA processing enzyme)
MRQVTVLGTCGAFPEPGRACSGFAVDWDGYRLVLDLGYATLARLLAHWPDGAVDAVAITHEHPDHCVDLHGLFRMRFCGGAGGPRLPLYCPDPLLAELGRDADLFIIEATERDGEIRQPIRNLMTAREAGQWARRAGAHRLMLTHFWPGNDRAAAVAAAAAEFNGNGEVLAADEDLVVGLGQPGRRTPAS